jgi:hypothetical protein
MTNEQDPASPATPNADRPRLGRRGVLLLGTMGTAALGVATIATRGAFADAPAATTAVGGTTSTSSSPTGSRAGTGPRPGFAPPTGGPSFGTPNGGPRGGWTVSAVQGSTITAKRADGTTLTITTNGGTTFHVARPGQPPASGALTDVGVGEHITVIGTLTGTGAVTATAVGVQPARTSGRVTAVSGSDITVGGAGGSAQHIHVGSNTVYRLDAVGGVPRPGQLSDVQVGASVSAEGTVGSDGSLQAQLVQVTPPSVDGTVSSVTGSTILVQRPQRLPRPRAGATTTATATASAATQTIHVGAATRYLVSTTYGPGITSAGSMTNVTAGTHVHATGTLNSDGSLTATTVLISQPPSRTTSAPGR